MIILSPDHHAAGFAIRTDVIATEVDQHYMLGDLLLVGQQDSASASSSSRVAPRLRVPAIGRTVMVRLPLRTRISGEAPTT